MTGFTDRFSRRTFIKVDQRDDGDGDDNNDDDDDDDELVEYFD